MQLFSADATIFKKKKIAPQNIKNCPQKLLIIPLDQQFSIQQVFALCNWDSFIVCYFLIFEVVKLCRMKIESPDRYLIKNHFSVIIWEQAHSFCVSKIGLYNFL